MSLEVLYPAEPSHGAGLKAEDLGFFKNITWAGTAPVQKWRA